MGLYNYTDVFEADTVNMFKLIIYWPKNSVNITVTVAMI